MTILSFTRRTTAALAILALTGITTAAHAQVAPGYSYKTLVNFSGTGGATPGQNPYGGVTLDGAGNLYGTTAAGGASGLGTLWKYNLATQAYTVPVNFPSPGGDYFPRAGLTLDASGRLYGTTSFAGSGGNGTVYRYDPVANSVTTLISFTGTSGVRPGREPDAAVTIDISGNIWGTTNQGGITGSGGANGFGTVWRYNPATSTFSTPIFFTGNAGAMPGNGIYGPVTFDTAGNLYGTTFGGGANGRGTLFRYNPTTTAFTTLVDFSGVDSTYAGVTIGPDGNLYGTSANEGGTNGLGSVWKYDLTSNTFGELFDFTGFAGAFPGARPHSSLTFDTAGNLWGTTYSGGGLGGNVWKYNLSSSAYTQVVGFTGDAGSVPGSLPEWGAKLTFDAAGNVYGTTATGGTSNAGTVFVISAVTSPEPSAFALLALGMGGSIVMVRHRVSRKA